jgi:phytoene desaturase
VSKITHTDPSMAPEWCENLFILVPIPNGIEISNNQKEQYKNMVRKIVEKMAGEDIVWHITTASSRAEPGNQKDMAESRDLTLSMWSKWHIEVEEVFTINDFKSRYNSWKGTALWLAHPIMQTAVFRPNNISKKLDNLFYVWHNTNPWIGVPMVIISAQLALERIKKCFTS